MGARWFLTTYRQPVLPVNLQVVNERSVSRRVQTPDVVSGLPIC